MCDEYDDEEDEVNQDDIADDARWFSEMVDSGDIDPDDAGEKFYL